MPKIPLWSTSPTSLTIEKYEMHSFSSICIITTTMLQVTPVPLPVAEAYQLFCFKLTLHSLPNSIFLLTTKLISLKYQSDYAISSCLQSLSIAIRLKVTLFAMIYKLHDTLSISLQNQWFLSSLKQTRYKLTYRSVSEMLSASWRVILEKKMYSQ